MAEIKLLNKNGEEIGVQVLSDEIFAIEVNNQVIYDAIRVYRSNSRQDSSRTKRRDEVRGGGRKPWRQKGTGRARQGSIRSPQWRGGGVVFGPSGDQHHTLKQNKKERVLALKSALTTKFNNNELIIVDNLNLEIHKTKQMLETLEKLGVSGKVTIYYTEEGLDLGAFLAGRNLPNLFIEHIDAINVYDLLDCDKVIIVQKAVEILQEGLLNG